MGSVCELSAEAVVDDVPLVLLAVVDVVPEVDVPEVVESVPVLVVEAVVAVVPAVVPLSVSVASDCSSSSIFCSWLDICWNGLLMSEADPVDVAV